MAKECIPTGGDWSVEEGPCVVAADGVMVADCCVADAQGIRTEEQCEANAKLIAAAPKLLQACRVAISVLRDSPREIDKATLRSSPARKPTGFTNSQTTTLSECFR